MNETLEKIKRGEKVETRSAPLDPETLDFNKNPKFLNQWTYIAPGLHSCFDWLCCSSEWPKMIKHFDSNFR